MENQRESGWKIVGQNLMEYVMVKYCQLENYDMNFVGEAEIVPQMFLGKNHD